MSKRAKLRARASRKARLAARRRRFDPPEATASGVAPRPAWSVNWNASVTGTGGWDYGADNDTAAVTMALNNWYRFVPSGTAATSATYVTATSSGNWELVPETEVRHLQTSWGRWTWVGDLRVLDGVRMTVPAEPRQPTWRDHAHEQIRVVREISEAAQRECQAAIERAKGLLLSMLSPAQRDDFERTTSFTVRSQRGRTYRIRPHAHRNVELLDEQGQAVMVFCAGPQGGGSEIPIYDVMLSQKITLELAEEEFHRVSNAMAPRTLASVPHPFRAVA